MLNAAQYFALEKGSLVELRYRSHFGGIVLIRAVVVEPPRALCSVRFDDGTFATVERRDIDSIFDAKIGENT